VLDCSSMIDIDSTAMHVLKETMHELSQNNCQLFFACMKGPIRDAFKRFGVVGEV
jgi:anti-anti-sigma regulatory factor